MLRRPLALPTIGFVTGIVIAEYCPLRLTVYGSLATLALLIQAGTLLCIHWRSRISGYITPSVCVTACALGALAYRIDQSIHSPGSLVRLTTAEPVLGSLRAELIESPALRLSERRGVLVARTAVRVRVRAWRPERSQWLPAEGTVLLTLRGALPSQAWRGRSMEAYGILEKPGPPDAPGVFDFATFLRHQGIHRVFRVESTNDFQLDPFTGGVPWSERFLPWAHAVLSRGVPDDEPARLLRAMTLGWQTPLSGEVDDVFMRAGTMHVFAISGLHIALLTTMVVQLFRAFRLSRLLAGALALPLMWGYVAATGWQASAVRSAVMASVVLASVTIQRPADLLNSLAGAGALILVNDPGQLFQSGFQLSFGAVAGLALLVPPLQRRLLAAVQFDPWVPDSLRPLWQRRLAKPLESLAMNVSVGVAALLASVPLTVHHFNLVSPVSLLANLIVVPLSSLALAATAASLAVALFAPWLSEIFNASGWFWMLAMVDLSRWFASWPGGWFSVAAPAWPWWLGWYGALGLAWKIEAMESGVLRGAGWQDRWIRFGIVTVALWMISGLGAWWSFHRKPRIFVFRQEPGLFAHSIDGDVLFDGGRAGTGQRLVVPFLRANGVNRLDLHEVSQGVQRFCGLGPELLLDYPPGRAWVPTLNPSRQPILRRYLTNLSSRHVPVEVARRGSRFAGWSVVAPDQVEVTRSGRSADYAPILRGEFDGVSVLWLGAAGPKVLFDLMQAGREPRATLAIAVAVAGTEPLPDELLASVRPQLAIVVTSQFPAASQITPETRLRLERAECPVLFTDEEGGIEITFGSGKLTWRCYGTSNLTARLGSTGTIRLETITH